MKPNIKKKIKELNMLFDYIQKKIEEKDFTEPIPDFHPSDSSILLAEADDKKINFQSQDLAKTIHSNVADLKKEIIDTMESISDLKSTIRHLVARKDRHIQNLEHKILNLREQLANTKDELIDLKGKIRIYCRIKGGDTAAENRFVVNRDENTIAFTKKGKFRFDRIFDDSCSQEQLFSEMAPFIGSATNGYSVCVLAYGQTGAGKTYTMLGDHANLGLVPRSLKFIFGSHDNIRVAAMFFEIYNEKIKDLITGRSADIKIYGESTVLTSIEWTPVESYYELDALISDIAEKRRTGQTRCNEHSSRSHMFSVIQVEKQLGGRKQTGHLIFVDLAGSERLKASQAEGLRLEETRKINSSLSSLRCVIDSLYRGDSHVPYRDSKLTMVLKMYFTNRSRVILLTNVSMDERNLEETLCTLRFSQVAGRCMLGKVEKNKE